jgi:carboxyl-terminal processing protease
MTQRFKLFVVTSSSFLVILLLVGSMLGQSASPEDAYRHIAVYTDVLSKIKSEYVEEPDIKSVTLGALNGLLESIDPYASYLSADQYKQYLKQKDTHKGDVGLTLSKKYGHVGVVGAAPGSPAAKAGIGTGDVIEAIKGITTRDMPLAYADLMLRGEPGATVEVTVLRFRKPEPQKITLTRAILKAPPVSSKLLPEQVGYVQVQSTEAGKTKEVAAALNELEKQGAKRLVLDLRNSSSGLTDEGIALANLFLEKGSITYRQGQRVTRENFQADSSKAMYRHPLVLITNRGTAGGAEIAAAAILDNKRAEVVGERTYGDAAVRKPILLDDGSAVILSVAKYYSPSGKAIQDTGVTPSVPLVETEAASDLDDDQPERPQTPEVKKSEDALLKKAIEVVTKGVTQASSPGSDSRPDPDRVKPRPLTTIPK